MEALMRRYGKRQLHQTLDHLAETTPNRLYATIPRTSDVIGGFLDVSCSDMSHCSSFMADWIATVFGRSKSFETLCYMGIPDLRSVVLFFAAVKCGYKVIFPSPRNPASTNASLLEQTQCKIVIHAVEVEPIVRQMGDSIPGLRYLQCPSFEAMLAAESVSFSYPRMSWDEAKNNPIVVLHSSGSTGVPRPITMTHASFGVVDNDRNIPQVPGRVHRDFSMWDFPGGGKFYHVFPYFHLAGFLSNIVCPTFSDAASPVLGPPLQPPSSDLLRDIMTSQQLKALYIPPSIAEQLIKEPGSMDLFKKLDFVSYAGAPFSPEVGNKLLEITHLISLYGTTEGLGLPQLVPPPEAWDYLEWNPNIKHEMQSSDDEPGTYELVLYADPNNDSMSAISHNMPGVSEWRTKDLFKPHPILPNLWKYHGRRDDIVVLSNGEKFNPVPFELSVQSHSSVTGALIVGASKVKASLLLEPINTIGTDESDKQALIDSVWSQIEAANALVPGHGRISRSHILVVDKPFTRAGKGTIVRKLTASTFESEIESLYRDDPAQQQAKIPSHTRDRDQITDLVRSSLEAFFPAVPKMNNGDDLFSFGLDSLGTVELIKDIKVKLHDINSVGDMSWLSPTTIYQYPTVQKLAYVIQQYIDTGAVPQKTTYNHRHEFLDRFVKQYTSYLPPKSAAVNSALTVALTGSTGSLGTALLASLLKESKVKRVICLNRDLSARNRQMKALAALGLTAIDPARVAFMTIDLGEPNLGLYGDDLSDLLQNTDILIHNAWRLDFNLALESFENPYIRSVRSIVDLSLASCNNLRLFFVSSISSMIKSGRLVPETVPIGASDPMPLGYAESKCVSEMILAEANRVSHVPVGILRVGQIAGSTNPQDPPWPTHEWLYPVILAAQKTGTIPGGPFQLDWIPINLAVKAITEILISVSDLTTIQVYNIVNPQNTPWDALTTQMRACFGPQSRVIPLQDWINAVSSNVRLHEEDRMLEAALKLVREMNKVPHDIRFATDNARSHSSTMSAMQSIGQTQIKQWLAQWGLA